MDKKVSNAIAIVVTIVWATSFLLDIFLSSYDPPASIGGIMMIVVGAAFAGNVLTRGKSEDQNTKHKG